MKEYIHNWLQRTDAIRFSLYAIAAAFITYFSMYAFRKPFSAALFEGHTFFGIDYKILAITAQIIGYTLSKFVGIKLISELKAEKRIVLILVLMAIAWLALLLFAIFPPPFNVLMLFLNGLPLGMIWGVVFSFLEGRRFTEMLGAGMAVSFIVSSGVVKSVGRSLVYNWGFSEFWMPFWAGLLFVPFLLLGVWLLSAIPAPSAEDRALRTNRIPMDSRARWDFFKTFSWGILATVTIYIFLTIFRDIRDNFALEIWNALGFTNQPAILATSEIPVAIGVLVIIALMSFFKDNRKAFFMNFFIIAAAGVVLIITTFLYQNNMLNPALWMIFTGFGMYLAYISFHTFLYERLIAHFRYKSNIGFLMYISDAFGYLGSVSILMVKNYWQIQISWLSFFTTLAYLTGCVIIVIAVLALFYFMKKEKLLLKE